MLLDAPEVFTALAFFFFKRPGFTNTHVFPAYWKLFTGFTSCFDKGVGRGVGFNVAGGFSIGFRSSFSTGQPRLPTFGGLVTSTSAEQFCALAPFSSIILLMSSQRAHLEATKVQRHK
jgi:hypothetical protein